MFKHAETLAETVSQENFNDPPSFDITTQVLDVSHIAEAPPRLSLRFLRPHPALDVLSGSHQQVKSHLIVHLLLDPVLAQQSI
jgi:hypothetical protein